MAWLGPSTYIIRFFETQRSIFSSLNRTSVFPNIHLPKQYCTARKEVPNSDKMTEKIKNRFPSATQVVVEDVSSGCGYMFRIFVEAQEFKGLSTVKQHRLINEVLKEDIQNMHGLRIETKVSEEANQ